MCEFGALQTSDARTPLDLFSSGRCQSSYGPFSNSFSHHSLASLSRFEARLWCISLFTIPKRDRQKSTDGFGARGFWVRLRSNPLIEGSLQLGIQSKTDRGTNSGTRATPRSAPRPNNIFSAIRYCARLRTRLNGRRAGRSGNCVPALPTAIC